jgi:hypothetical protein
MVWVKLFRFQGNGGQRNPLFALEERIHTLSYQTNGPLPQRLIHGRFKPGMSRLPLFSALPFWVGSGRASGVFRLVDRQQSVPSP